VPCVPAGADSRRGHGRRIDLRRVGTDRSVGSSGIGRNEPLIGLPAGRAIRLLTPIRARIPLLLWHDRQMLHQLREMPNGVRVFLGYGFVVLAFLGLTLPRVINEAVEAPISPIGLLWMLLLAYLIFTLTLVLQRKQAAFGLAVGLATLTLPLIPILAGFAGLPGALAGVALAAGLFWALRRPGVRGWFSEP